MAIVLGLCLGAPRLALAGDPTLAESLFREGKGLMDAGDFARACPKLEESQRQDPASGTLLALAYCYEQAGKTASAWGTYNSAAMRARQEGRSDREQAARERGTALEQKLSTLTLEVPADVAQSPGFTVRRDGETVPPAAWGSAVPLDPGEHLIEVSADGKKPWQAKVSLGANADKQKLQVPPLEAGPAAPAAPPPVAPPQAAPSADEGSKGGSSLPIIGLVTGGVGVVALGVGTYFGLRAKSLNDDSKEQGCNAQNECTPTGGEKRDDAKSAATASTIAFVVGGVLTAGGVALYLIGSSSNESPPAAALAVSPALGPNQAGFALSGKF